MKKKQWLLEQNEHKNKQRWVKFLQQKDLLVWRRPLNDDGLYQYKGRTLIDFGCHDFVSIICSS